MKKIKLIDDILFDGLPKAFARFTDPQTSHEAASSINDDLPELEMKVFLEIKISGENGLILDEVVDATHLEKVTASPRFAPLERKGIIRRADFSRVGKSGRRQTVWIAV